MGPGRAKFRVGNAFNRYRARFRSRLLVLARQSEENDDDHEDDKELPRLPVERSLIVVSEEKLE